MASRPLPSLPVAGNQTHERADAARNRQKILCAAQKLIDRHGVEHVSMDMVAEEAGVGKGTIFRRFGDRGSLARALLDDRERRFQDEFIRGEPPLGPGVPPAERLRAFGHEMMGILESHGDLILAAEHGAYARFKAPPYRVYRVHVMSLLEELDPRIDGAYHADSLLAVLAADQYLFLRRERGMSVDQLRAGWDSVIAAVEALAER